MIDLAKKTSRGSWDYLQVSRFERQSVAQKPFLKPDFSRLQASRRWWLECVSRSAKGARTSPGAVFERLAMLGQVLGYCKLCNHARGYNSWGWHSSAMATRNRLRRSFSTE